MKNFIERYKTIKKEHQINAEIRDKEVRLIGETGEQLGIVSSREALRIAEESGLDLVKISPNANPPVCKVMNYGKFLFEQNKKAKEEGLLEVFLRKYQDRREVRRDARNCEAGVIPQAF